MWLAALLLAVLPSAKPTPGASPTPVVPGCQVAAMPVKVGEECVTVTCNGREVRVRCYASKGAA